MIALRMCACALLAALAGCGPAARHGGFDSPNPAARMYAIEHAARDGDRTALKRIVESLDSDDPAVRSLAIAALKRLTGQTLGYRDYDPPQLRLQAAERWQRAIKTGEFRPVPADAPAGDAPAQNAVDHG